MRRFQGNYTDGEGDFFVKDSLKLGCFKTQKSLEFTVNCCESHDRSIKFDVFFVPDLSPASNRAGKPKISPFSHFHSKKIFQSFFFIFFLFTFVDKKSTETSCLLIEEY